MGNDRKAKESQNQSQFDNYRSAGGVVMGPYTSHIWRSDPRHLAFLLARYKFAAKILAGRQSVLEAGCGDAFGTALLLQTVQRVHAVDFEPIVIEDNITRTGYGDRCTFEVVDLVSHVPTGKFDGALSLDVIEHIPHDLEGRFMSNICACLGPESILVMGTPNVTAHAHASPASREGHINLKGGDTLRSLLQAHFQTVMVFSMNDEVVHTGYYPMAHYLIGVGVGPRGPA